ncbi:MAG TPA: class I SAM-dependent methyltransferase [Geobacteraceae bacterium]|nr:class I SAM-dependent methyltransferase [Geobacteraceae bacterium]
MDLEGMISGKNGKSFITQRSAPVNDPHFWDGRAESFTEFAARTGYAEKFLKIMNPEPDWTVLDMACGGGTLAVPLAAKVKSVTAVDFSTSMLAVLLERCLDRGIKNVKRVHGRWEDDWNELGIGMHDVAVASRSLLADDARASILKLQNAARRQVYISTMVDAGPFDRRMFEATGRKFSMGPDYIYYYNLLYEMGIHANVAFIPEYHADNWANHEEALAGQRWMFNSLTGEEEEKLRAYLEDHLSFDDGRWWLPYERLCLWAVMWWDNRRHKE